MPGRPVEGRTVRPLLSGLGLVESVRVRDGEVWFSDWLAGEIHRLDVASGADSVVHRVPSLPLCFDLRGEEIAVLDSAGGRLLRGPLSGPLRPWADVRAATGGGGNEVTWRAGGSCFVNSGNFDPAQGFPTEPVGVVAHVAADGTVRTVAERLAFPNGMALSADGATLLVAESHAGRLTAFTVAGDGSLSERRVWAEVPGSAPDGISWAPDGTCWYAEVPGRVVVRVAEGGRVLERVDVGRGAFSCALGPDGSRLYVAAAHWPGGERMGDPTHDWDGSLLAVDLA